MRKLSVHHINQHLQGGAAIAARRLFDSLLAYEDLELRFYSQVASNDPGYYQFPSAKKKPLLTRVQDKIPFLESGNHKIYRELYKYMETRPVGLEPFSVSFLNCLTPPPLPLPDIIHLHWIGSFLDYESFFAKMPINIPVVWTLHDMHPFTGGCHYSKNCLKFQTVCERCPELSSYSRNDLAKYNFLIKEKAFAGRKMYVVADSEWLKTQAANSYLFKHAKSIDCIHYGLDNLTYMPKDKISCRKALGIDPHEADLYLCFGANDISIKRKGMAELIEAIKLLSDQNLKITCLVFGNGQFESDKNTRFIEFGNIASEQLLSIIYSAADIFVMPSLEEAFGQTCLEAMSCAVPVVAFDTGGIPDMIRNHDTGMLAMKGNSADLAEKILFLLRNPELRSKISENSRQAVLDRFTLSKQASKYYNLYKKVLN